MSKQSVEWYKECYENMCKTYTKDLNYYYHVKGKLDSLKESIERYGKQIERAIEEGKDSFDEDRYKPKGELK